MAAGIAILVDGIRGCRCSMQPAAKYPSLSTLVHRQPFTVLPSQERSVAIPRWEQPDLGVKMAKKPAPAVSQSPGVPSE